MNAAAPSTPPTADIVTRFGALDDYQKGSIELVSGKASHYVFSNIFEVAATSAPYEKVVVGKNLDYVIETVRAEGDSPWYINNHDEFAVVMDGQVRIDYIDPEVTPVVGDGTHLIGAEPAGKVMGHVILRRGHQAILPARRAYRFSAAAPGVMLVQTILGPLSVEKWSEICFH